MQLKTKSSVLNKILLPGLLLAFWSLIFYFSPMTEDDCHFWSLRIVGLKEVFDFALNYGNGRLLGNMGIMYLVEYKALRVIVKALSMTALVLLLPKALKLRGKVYALGSFLLLTLCAPSLFSQVYTWTSGFQNYVPAVLLQLACICMSLSGRAVFAPVVFVLSAAAGLYVEHSSVINLLSALALFVFALKQDKKQLPCAIAFVLGSFLGLAAMLIIPKLSALPLVDMATYKSTVLSGGLVSGLVTVAKNAVVLLCRFSENVVLTLSLSTLMCLLLHKYELHLEKNEKNILFAALLIPVILADLANMGSMGAVFGDAALFETLLLAACMGIWLLALLWSAVRLALKLKTKEMQLLLLLLGFALIAAAPMLLLKPLVFRLSFHCYVFFAAAALYLMKLALSDEDMKLCTAGFMALSLIAALWLSVLFADINRLYNIREEHIAKAVSAGESSVDFFMIPSDYVFDYWDAEVYSWYYDALYGTDVKLQLNPADTWLTEFYH